MSNSQAELNVSFDNENLCVVCCKTVEIYSLGICNHRVCFECSTRMRVLCSQNECPICRGQMPKVIFTREIQDFGALFGQFEKSPLQDRKYGLIFCEEDIKKAYQQLLELRCTLCSGSENAPSRRFYLFQQLKDHMRREHDLYYCDLCVENLKIFCFERKCYTRQQLGYHRRKGDPDNTSHRGHPLCEFCDTRFVDSDELFRHLRRNHMFCHLCDADGKHQYYNVMHDLQKHFRNEHYLCEEGDCSTMPMIAVFRTDIDLKAHIATAHSRFLSRSANRQARTLEVEFTLAPRPGERNRRQNNPSRNTQGSNYEDEGAVGYEMEPGGPGGGPIKQINPLTASDFPALGNVTVQNRPLSAINFTSKVNSLRGQDFPTLGGSRAPAVSITTNPVRKKAPEVTITRTVRGGNVPVQNVAKKPENFPRLGAPSSTVHVSVSNGPISTPTVSIQVNHNGGITTHISSSQHNGFNINQKPAEAFPALGGSTAPQNPQWVQAKSRKNPEAKVKKVAPAPQLPPSDLSQFPSLSAKEKNVKKSSVTVPVSGTWAKNGNNLNHKAKTAEPSTSKVTENETKSKNKKNKKKTNIITESEIEVKLEKKNNENGVVKKRSELNIGSLTLKDTKAPPPGFPKPPPGFTNITTQNFPTLGASNDLTFTSSSGQKYAIKPTNYHQPSGFSSRNQNLIKRLMNVIDNESTVEFKSYSNRFREGSLDAESYHSYCNAILGSSFNELFPELLVLLPDVDRQRELFQVCDTNTKKNLLVCENCSQIIFKRELREHYNYHSLESNFPSLGNSGEPSNVWKK